MDVTPTVAVPAHGLGAIRLRVLLLMVLAIVLGLAAGRIFDEPRASLLLAAVVPLVVALPLVRRPWYVQMPIAAVAVVGAVALATLVEGGRVPADVVDAFVRGPRRILSTDWPSPTRPDLVGAVAGLLAAASAVAASLASRMRWHVLPLAPMVGAFVVICALSAPQGPAAAWLLALAPPALLFAALRPGRSVGERVRILAGERYTVPLAAVAILAAFAVSVPVALADRADPRRQESAATTAQIVDPMESVLALQRLDPPIVVFDVRATSGDSALPPRWRMAMLDTYDGRRWTPTLTLRPIGRRLGPDDPESISADIEFRSDHVELLPLPGDPILVGADVQTDQNRSLVALVEHPAAGQVVPVTARIAPGRGAATGEALGTRPVDEIAARFTDVATALAGDGTVLERLEAIESALRSEYALDTDAPGGGVQLALVERFLTETRRGNAEQFVTAFALLARSLGVNTRIATGFAVPPGDVGPVVELRSDLARVWPEVEVPGVGWIAFDPVPEEEAADESAPPVPPQEQTPVAPQPPIAPPAEPADDDVEPPAEPEPERSDRWSTFVTWTGRVALGAGAVLTPLVLAAGTIVVLKLRRRRRLLRVADERQRVRAAWAVATDALVDAGLTIAPAWTDRQIAHHGTPLAATAGDDLVRLGALSSAATYGPQRLADPMAADAVAALGHIERAIRATRTRWQRLRWRLSLRSLRRSTRSPVLGDDRRAAPRPRVRAVPAPR